MKEYQGGTHLLVKFEGVAERVQTFGLLRVCVSKGLRGSFEEVLVVAHLGYWHAVELVWTGDREIHQHEGRILHFLLSKRNLTPAKNHSFSGPLDSGWRLTSVLTKHKRDLQSDLPESCPLRLQTLVLSRFLLIRLSWSSRWLRGMS